MEESWVKCLSICSRYCGTSYGYGWNKSRLKGKSSCLLCRSPLQPALSHKAPSALSTWKATGAGPPLCQPLLTVYRHGWNGHLKLAQPRLHSPEPVSKEHTHYLLYYPKQLVCPTREWTTEEKQTTHRLRCCPSQEAWAKFVENFYQ